ncbi:MAG: tetratricopeptide repeat protein [Chloroflexi bacterium]|nr:tetratricopeptide repeat protein [Chloroflexota bacterium]
MSAESLQTLIARAQAQEPLGRYDEALADLERVIVEAQQEGLDGFRATALQYRGRLLRLKGALAAAEESATAAARLFAELGDQAGQAQALLVLGEVLSDQARLSEFEGICQQALALSREAASLAVEARALMLLATAEVYLGRMRSARTRLGEARRAFEALGDRRGAASSLLMLGRVDHARGRLRGAARSLRQALAIFQELGERRAITATSVNLGQIDMERGALVAARRFAESAVALSRELGDVAMQARSAVLLAQVEVELGQWEPPVGLLREAEVLCTAGNFRSILPEIYRVLAEAYLAGERVAEAETYARLGRTSVTEDDHYSQGTTELVLAQVLGRLGLVQEANGAFNRALGHLEEADEAFEIGWGHLGYAQFLSATGSRDQAGQHLAAARRAFVALGARSRVEAIDRLA